MLVIKEKSNVTVHKEQLWEGFTSFMNLDHDSKVGRETFFSLFGNALSNPKYKTITSVYRKQRRIGFKGLVLKAIASHTKADVKSGDYQPSSVDVTTVQGWMKKNFLEGNEDDNISKEELWADFTNEHGTNDKDKPTFFAIIGKYVFGRPPFSQVKALKKGGKSSVFEKLRKRSFENLTQSNTEKDGDVEVSNEADEHPIAIGDKEEEETAAGILDESSISKLPNENYSPQRNSSEQRRQVVSKDEDFSEIEVGDDNRTLHFPETPTVLEGTEDEKTATVELSGGYSSEFSDEDDDFCPQRNPSIKRRRVLSDDEEISDEEDMHDLEMTGEESVDNRKQESGSDQSDADHLFKKHHKCMDYLMASHLPGNPASFQAYLTSVFPDPSDFQVEREEIHSSSARASNYKDLRTRAFLAATFPPLMVGSLAGGVTGISVRGDKFPQFTHSTKGNFKCAICIPYLHWAIQNNQPHSVARSKKASTEAILKGTAELDFSGLVQVKEHSASKCHLEACQFWIKDKEPTAKPLTSKEGVKKTRTMEDYLVKPSKPLNYQRPQRPEKRK